jgi:uncharacterized SAM-binding protein YcdF (DUF218 family)
LTSINAIQSQFLDRTKSQGSRLRRYFAIMLVMVALCIGAWVERATLLRGSADLWIVSDPITPADAVVVLGGGLDVRPFVAADLFKKGLVGKVLISQVEDGPPAAIDALVGHTEENLKVLLKLGVPESAIETFGNANKNTYEEAVALKSWANRNGVSVLIIPTEIFAARRVRWIFRREFSGTSVHIEVPSFDPPRNYSRANWWKTEFGVVAFHNELVKYLYYRLIY